MTAKSDKTQKTETIKIRIDPLQKDLIDLAASMVGTTRSAFVLDAATSAAEETIKDRTSFYLSESQWIAFNKALDSPPQKNELIAKLIQAPTPW